MMLVVIGRLCREDTTDLFCFVTFVLQYVKCESVNKK